MLSAIFTGSPAVAAHLRPCSASLLPTKKYRGRDQVSPVFGIFAWIFEFFVFVCVLQFLEMRHQDSMHTVRP